MHLKFVESESTFSYLVATREYLDKHGRPIALYSDKHSVFRVSGSSQTSTRGLTQFGRAMESLNIDIICANSSQAKGRVERVNRTLQDRLVKELRLQGISSFDEANDYLPEYVERHNAKFMRAAKMKQTYIGKSMTLIVWMKPSVIRSKDAYQRILPCSIIA